MRKGQKIEKFIKTWFGLFGFDFREIVGFAETEESEYVDAPIACGDGVILENVEKAAEAFGVSIDDVLNMNGAALRCQLDRYPIFDLLREYDLAHHAAFYAQGYETARLLDAIFRDDFSVSDAYPSKFDFDGVPARLIALLKQYDKALPGTYHVGATIKEIQISTQWFCHYSKINELCRSFISMVERAEALFFKALDTDLSEQEISEYNLIVSTIGLKDAVLWTSGNLYYRTLVRRRKVYKEENHTDFFSYVLLAKSRFFHPYRCAEFVSDRELVQRFVSFYPHMKAAMRIHARDVENYKCTFRWSDEPPRAPSDDAIYAYLNGKISSEELDEETGLVITFVPKTADELGEDRENAAQLRILSGPEALGGVANTPFPGPTTAISRMITRLNADWGVEHG